MIRCAPTLHALLRDLRYLNQEPADLATLTRGAEELTALEAVARAAELCVEARTLSIELVRSLIRLKKLNPKRRKA